MARVFLRGGEVVHNVHSSKDCLGPRCPIHNVSNHSMRKFRQHWRGDRGIMERICPHGIGPHGIGHPDPDDYRIWKGLDPGIHGCCGICCHEE